MSYMNVPNRIAEKYSKMTKAEKRIADYFMKQSGNLQLVSITELAEQCKVADSTIFRFCKMLGYKGYNDFKLALAKEQGSAMGASARPDDELDVYSSITRSDDVPTTGQKLKTMYFAAIEQTLELLKPESVALAARILKNSERVYCLGQGGSLITAMEAWVRFATVAREFTTVQDTHLQMIAASLLTERDTIWFFSYSGATKDMVDILTLARERGARIIVVTRYAKSPATQFADVVLICGSNESPLQSGTVVAKLAQLMVIDMVYQEYIRLDADASEENRDITVKAISNRLL
ncbi:MAG: MurR/RpiR family transcriptional regulator [Hungatella hathewayi]|nr:MurR/RpiR family transcriptional regulator [Hungatella hathewayi]